ncbi:MAG: hypothetical protein ACRD5Z_04475, partial [Bryobacteraceae bacterium]
MNEHLSRSFRGAPDLPSLIRFAADCARTCLPAPSYYHPGDIVWQLYSEGPSDNVRIWIRAERDEEHFVAFAVFEPPFVLQFMLHPSVLDPEQLTHDVLSWGEGRSDLYKGDAGAAIAYHALGR